jgi:hypothetical protein
MEELKNNPWSLEIIDNPQIGNMIIAEFEI